MTDEEAIDSAIGAIVTDAIVEGITAWKVDDEAAIDSAIAKAVRAIAASAIEARRAETLGSVGDESAAPKADAQ